MKSSNRKKTTQPKIENYSSSSREAQAQQKKKEPELIYLIGDPFGFQLLCDAHCRNSYFEGSSQGGDESNQCFLVVIPLACICEVHTRHNPKRREEETTKNRLSLASPRKLHDTIDSDCRQKKKNSTQRFVVKINMHTFLWLSANQF